MFAANWGKESVRAHGLRSAGLLLLAIFLAAWWALQSFGNAGLWSALIASYVARGGLQAARYPAQFRATFPKS